MTTRTVTAEAAGPITIVATLLGHAGIVSVRADATCTRAEITIRTNDETGPAADAVRDAVLDSDPIGALTVRVEGSGGSNFSGGGGGVHMSASGNHGSVVQVAGSVYGSMTGMTIVNGRVVSGGSNIQMQATSPIEITALVPEGSTLICRTQSADVSAQGAIRNVAANTQSGDIRVGRATRIKANTQSGRIDIGLSDIVEANTMSGDIAIEDFAGTAQLKTMSGGITVHATAGGDLNARTMSGDITVTASQAAIDDDLTVQTNTMSGRVRVPTSPQAGGSEPRRRR